MKNRFTLAVFLVLVLALVAIPVGAQDPVTFTFGEFANPVKLDTIMVTDGVSFRAASQGCESLLEFEGETTVPGPNLAQSWTTSEDGLSWTFQLVEGATFHDGTPFNAEAVVYNYDRWRLSDHPEHFTEDASAFEYFVAQFNGFDDESLIANVEATGEYEVTFTLRQPLAAFLNNIAMKQFSIHSPAAIQEHGAAYGTPSVGYSCTGPYRFVSWESDVQVVLERNAEYWGEIPGNVERIVFRIIPDSAARYAALQAGEIDAFEQPNVEDIEAIESSDELYIQYRPPFNVLYVAFNWRVQEFQNPLVRQAISYALNRQEIVDAYFPPGAVAANTFHPPSITLGFNENISTTFDADRARELLAEAGYPDGINEVNILGVDDAGNVTDEVVETGPLRLYFMPVVRPYNPDGEGIGEAMVAYLQAVGINAELASAGDWSTFLAERAAGNLVGLYQLGWTGDNGDPDNFMGYFFADAASPLAREGFYQNEAVADLLQQGRVSLDAEERNTLYEEAEALVAENADRVFIAHNPVPLAFRNRVSGYITNPLGSEYFKYVTITD